MKRLIFFLLVAGIASGSGFASNPNMPDQVPFQLAHGFGIVVRGAIGARNNLNFLIDTGAVPSVLGQDVARQLGIAGPKGGYSLLDRSSSAQYVTVVDIRLGWIQATSLPMVVVNLHSISNAMGIRLDAIIGLDLLAGHPLSIDFVQHRVGFSLSGKLRYSVAVEIYHNNSAPYWVVPIDFAGHRLHVLLDTGTDNLTLFPEVPINPIHEVGQGPKSPSPANGKFLSHALLPSSLIVGDAVFREQVALELAGPADPELSRLDGVLGPVGLGITRLELDWEGKCLRWDTR